MSIETELKPNNVEKEELLSLADELEKIQNKKTNGRGDIVMQKLIRFLRDGNAGLAKIFLGNEADKFAEYREDAVPLIIEKLYGGNGSPWFTVERTMKTTKSESSK